MKVWTVANQKGGVGKTTTTVSLGGLLAGWGLRTLLVDMDPHGSLTSYFKYDPDTLEDSAFSLFQAAARKQRLAPGRLICPTGTPDLSLLPAAMALATLDRIAGKMEGMGLVLKRALSQLRDQYDFVLIDCPPILGMLLINALAACERLVIPVQTEFLALKGLERMLHTLEMVLKSRRSPLPYHIVPTLYDRRTRAAKEALEVLRETYGEHLWGEAIPVDTRFREASKAGLPPSLYDPKARGVAAYSELARVLLEAEGGEAAVPVGLETT